MGNGLLALGRAAELAGAAPHRHALLAHQLGAAHRAGLRHQPRRGRRRAQLQPHADHFGDDITGTAHDHAVADAHIQPGNLVGVVQGRIGHHHAGHLHRRQPRHRGGRTGAADLDLDVLHRGGLFLGRELVRNGPARCARDKPHGLLAGLVIKLVDHPVDIERQPVTRLADALVVTEQAIQAVHHLAQVADRKPPALQHRQGAGMGIGQLPAFDHTGGIGKKAEPALGHDPGIELTQGSGRGISRVGQYLAAAGAGLRVAGLEIGA